jgi:serine/threonine protein kinase
VTGRLGGERDLDGRSDLYALAGVLSEMLAGQPPFTGFTVESVIHEHLTASPPVITSIRLGTPRVQGPWIFTGPSWPPALSHKSTGDLDTMPPRNILCFLSKKLRFLSKERHCF